MALFIVRHRHEAEQCPATDPYMGAMLLNYLSRPNVRRQGVSIQGEAVVQGEHTLYMIIESSDEDRVRRFPIQHGYPLRLIVPGWYAVTSVKWLTEIEVIGHAFRGRFQADSYFYEWQREGQVVREPVTLQRVRALITEPGAGDEVDRGDLAIRGVAWSGAAPIARVEVSVGGDAWQEARLVGERKRHSWQWWELIARIEQPGTITVRARATDLAGRTQPERPEWNRLGYGNNSIPEVPVRVR
jgi:DMSO/TMAO reductase YedYZ molybdopterin-dependent catalytic subunit